MRPATRRTSTLAAQQGQRQMGQHEQVRPEEDDLISVGAEDIAQGSEADQNPMDPIHHDSNLADTNSSNVDTTVVHAVVQKLIDCGLFAQNAPMVGPQINMAAAQLPGTQHWPMQQGAGHYNMQQVQQGPQQASILAARSTPRALALLRRWQACWGLTQQIGSKTYLPGAWGQHISMIRACECQALQAQDCE